MIRRPVLITRLYDLARAPLALQILTGLVVVSVAAAAAGVFWRISGLDDGRDRVAVTGATTMKTAATDLSPILIWAPFGGAPGAIEATASGLVLKAIFLAVPAEASSALISVGSGPAVAVHPGQSLPNGAVVQAIAINHVVLSVSGGSESLSFPGPAASTESATAPAVDATPAATPPGSGPPSTPASSNGAGAMPSVVEQYRQRLAGNAPAVARDMGVTATAQGYRVGDDISPALRAAGLQPGDVVARVNNQPVGSDVNPRAILDQAITSGGARVDVVRNGRTLTLSFPLR